MRLEKKEGRQFASLTLAAEEVLLLLGQNFLDLRHLYFREEMDTIITLEDSLISL